MDSWDQRCWVTRAHDIEPHYKRHRFTGWSIGAGGVVMARIYDKLFEIFTKSRALYLFELWDANGRQAEDPVYRAEVQFRREALRECGIESPAHAISHLGGLWQYFSKDWLRLTVPAEDDTNQSRWPTHPFWEALSNIPWSGDEGVRLKRCRLSRIPRDERLFPAAFGYIAAFMARQGIEDFGEGAACFLREMRAHMDARGRARNKTHNELLQERIAAKGRLFNTIDNRANRPEHIAEILRQAEHYKRIRSGEDDGGDTEQ